MAESMLAVSDAGTVGLVERRFFTFGSPEEPFRLEGGGLLPEVTQ